MIRAPRAHEIPFLPQIENAADGRYARVGLPRVIDMPPATVASLEQGRRDGRLWVATSLLNRPVGFALMQLRGGTAWLDQLSVLDRWQGLGFGAALIDRTAATARGRGFDTLYLSTYLRVRWNAPFYARRGFVEVPRGKWPRAFRLQFMTENSHGHPSWQRTIMKRDDQNGYLQRR
ncbi:MAG: GNAT family N-acetyltransferase [Reyranella sp.]|nr:GNAT family N-acetyltransferase [Reyranella sp.]